MLPVLVEFDDVDEIVLVKDEKALIITLINIILRFDPDLIYGNQSLTARSHRCITIGYNVEKTSLFYISRRGYEYNLNFMDLVARSPSKIKEAVVHFLV